MMIIAIVTKPKSTMSLQSEGLMLTRPVKGSILPSVTFFSDRLARAFQP